MQKYSKDEQYTNLKSKLKKNKNISIILQVFFYDLKKSARQVILKTKNLQDFSAYYITQEISTHNYYHLKKIL